MVVELGGGDAEAGGVGLPDWGGRGGGSGEELEVTVGEEVEGSGGGEGGGAGGPEGDGVVGDGGEVGGGGRGDEGEGESGVWGGPGLVWVVGIEGYAR